jgi:hypothetical protein
VFSRGAGSAIFRRAGQRLRIRDEALPASMLTTDPPDHDRLRRPGSRLLGPAALSAQPGGKAELAGGLAERDRAGLADESLSVRGDLQGTVPPVKLYDEERSRFEDCKVW